MIVMITNSTNMHHASLFSTSHRLEHLPHQPPLQHLPATPLLNVSHGFRLRNQEALDSLPTARLLLRRRSFLFTHRNHPLVTIDLFPRRPLAPNAPSWRSLPSKFLLPLPLMIVIDTVSTSTILHFSPAIALPASSSSDSATFTAAAAAFGGVQSVYSTLDAPQRFLRTVLLL